MRRYLVKGEDESKTLRLQKGHVCYQLLCLLKVVDILTNSVVQSLLKMVSY